MSEMAVFSYCPDCHAFRVLPCTCDKKPAETVSDVPATPVASTVANTVSDAPTDANTVPTKVSK